MAWRSASWIIASRNILFFCLPHDLYWIYGSGFFLAGAIFGQLVLGLFLAGVFLTDLEMVFINIIGLMDGPKAAGPFSAGPFSARHLARGPPCGPPAAPAKKPYRDFLFPFWPGRLPAARRARRSGARGISFFLGPFFGLWTPRPVPRLLGRPFSGGSSKELLASPLLARRPLRRNY